MDVGSDPWKSLLIEGGRALGVDITPAHVDLFTIHATELLRWNRRINLTAITDPREVAVKHFLDSAAAVPVLPSRGRLLDLGSGGGFPGIVLKVLLPGLRVTLIDAARKKVSFQKEVLRRLRLPGITARQARAEAMDGPPFDVIVSRAFSDLGRFHAMALPLLGEGGSWVAMKGKAGPGEIRSVREAMAADPSTAVTGTDVEVTTYTLPYLGDMRSIVVHSRSNSSRV